jgi:hypothetical protein
MATAHYIDAMHLVKPYGYTHPHIELVHLTSGQVLARASVIRDILYGRGTYYTYRAGTPGAKVIAADCSECGSGDYITTEPDWTPDNNLLSLPKF